MALHTGLAFFFWGTVCVLCVAVYATQQHASLIYTPLPPSPVFLSTPPQVQKLTKGEVLMVNIGSTSVGGRVLSVKSESARLSLTMPVCTLEKEKVALSRRIEGHWR